MNTAYLDTMKEVKNKYKVSLEEGEKVVFTGKMAGLSTDEDGFLGADSFLTITNKRILADTGAGVWIVDIAEDAVDMYYSTIGKFLSKQEFIQVDLNKEMTYGIGIQKLHAYRYHLNKRDRQTVAEIARHMKE